MIIKNFLLATEKGLGNGETPIFPISIFKLKAGVNKLKTDPGYHLFKLACRVSAKRLFPNFSFLDAPHNAQYYKPGRPETEVAYMGCVVAKETITVNIEDITYSDASISKMYKIIREYITFKTGQKSTECSHGYINTSDFDIKILSKNTFVKLHGILRNKDTVSNPLIEVFYTDNKTKDPKSIIVTTDHPLVSQKGRTPAENLEIGDTLYNSINNDEYEITNIIHLDYKEDTYDVETENDLFDLSGILSHNCRTRVIGNFYDTENETTYGRGNLSFTSINLPRLAIEAKGNTEKFFKDLFTTMDLVKEQLLDRLEIQSRLHVYNMPFLMGQGVWCGSDKLSYTDEIREVIKQGSLSIGFIGLAEALYALYGKHHGESEEIHNIGKKIIQFMRYRCDEYAKEHKLNFSLLATPAEGLSGRFLNIDKKKYGIIPGVTDKDYYTNSFHIPVGFDISIAKKIELEAPFHAMTNAGHITYVELDGDVASNEDVFEKIILKMDKEGVGYGSINHPIDRDPVCGYTGIIHEECPNCGRKEKEDGIPHERIRRITGYLVGTLDRFNSAKLSEVLDRKKHKGFKSEDIIQ